MLTRDVIIAPSVLSADFSNLERDIKRLESVNVSMLHLDVMDGHFVPNISFGPSVIKAINKTTEMILDTHLMIANPDQYLEQFRDAGSDIITVHVETCTHLHRTITKIKELGINAGVSINPATSLKAIEEILPFVDLVLIMSVNPGFGGQKFISSSIQKINTLSKMISAQNLSTIIEVDGGIDVNTVKIVKDAGTHYLVAGNAIFGNGKIEQNYSQLISLVK
jgi:ribulose-phosphate 3-epimerase